MFPLPETRTWREHRQNMMRFGAFVHSMFRICSEQPFTEISAIFSPHVRISNTCMRYVTRFMRFVTAYSLQAPYSYVT